MKSPWLYFFALVALVALVFAVGHFHGPIAQTRLFGACWILAAGWCLFAKEVPVSIGSVEVARLRGWTKVFVILPLLALGLLVAIYAPEVTCWSNKRRHLCAAG